MAKMTLDQKIEKVKNSIKKEEEIISLSSAKVKEFNKELKSLLAEKDQQYANDFLSIMCENGFTSDEDKDQFMQLIKEQFKK